LRSSGMLIRGNETPSFALIEVMRAIAEAAQSSELRVVSTDYLVLMIRAQMEITVEYMNAHPESAEECRNWGFKMLWKELTGK
jgi:hypothetical protein